MLLGCAVLECSKTTQAGGLEVILSTDMPTPASFDTVHVRIEQAAPDGGWLPAVLDKSYSLPSPEMTLPTTIAIVAGQGPDQKVLVSVIGLKGGTTVVARAVETQVPTDRVAELPIVLAAACSGKLDCGAGESCAPVATEGTIVGNCESEDVPAGALPSYDPGDAIDAGLATTAGDSAAAIVPDSAPDADANEEVQAGGDAAPAVDASGDASTSDASDGASESDASDGASESDPCTLPPPAADLGADAGPGGSVVWAENFGLTGATQPYAIAVDPSSGHIVCVGFFDGTVNFGDAGERVHGDAASAYDAFVAALGPDGSTLWAQTFGNGSTVIATAVTVDPAGNIDVAGTFEGTVDFGCDPPLTAVGQQDVFLVQLTAGGACSWSKHFGAAGQLQYVDSIAADSAGTVSIAGVASGGVAVDDGGSPLSGIFLAQFTSMGDAKWSQSFDASCDEVNPTVAVDRTGNAILAGCFSGSASFRGTTNFGITLMTKSPSAYAAFVAKFDSDGVPQWAQPYDDDTTVSGVAADACGNVVVTGAFLDQISFGGSASTLSASKTGLPSSYAFLAKLDPSGMGMWSESFTGSYGALTPGSLAVDAFGRPTFTASVNEGNADFGGGTITSVSNGNSVAVASFTADGAYRWEVVGGPPSSSQSYGAPSPGVAAGPSSLVLAGDFGTAADTLVLGTLTLTAKSSGVDAFIASFAP